MSLSVIVKLSVTLCIFLSGNDSSKPLCFRDNHSHRLTERRRVLYMCQIQEFSASQVQHAFHRHEQSMQFIKYIEWLLCQPSPDWLLFWATLHCYLPHAIFSLCISATLKYISVSESGSNVCFITFLWFLSSITWGLCSVMQTGCFAAFACMKVLIQHCSLLSTDSGGSVRAYLQKPGTTQNVKNSRTC